MAGRLICKVDAPYWTNDLAEQTVRHYLGKCFYGCGFWFLKGGIACWLCGAHTGLAFGLEELHVFCIVGCNAAPAGLWSYWVEWRATERKEMAAAALGLREVLTGGWERELWACATAASAGMEATAGKERSGMEWGDGEHGFLMLLFLYIALIFSKILNC